MATKEQLEAEDKNYCASWANAVGVPVRKPDKVSQKEIIQLCSVFKKLDAS